MYFLCSFLPILLNKIRCKDTIFLYILHLLGFFFTTYVYSFFMYLCALKFLSRNDVRR
jgi:hypothetical protein